MTNDRDLELDQLLEPLRTAPVSPFFVKKWQRAIERSLRLRKGWLAQMTTAMAVGFALGAFVFHKSDFSPIPDAVATLESISVKVE